MTTSEANRVSPSVDVTPDAVVQATSQVGFVAEAKLSLPKDVKAWDKDFLQIEKYDDDLTGWWSPGERIRRHDILILVPINRATRFIDRLKEGVETKKWEFRRLVSVIGFFKQSGVKDFITLKKEWGELSDRGLSERLRESRAIDFGLLISKYKEKFIDSAPPLPYLLQIIWDNVFTLYAADVAREEDKNFVVLEVTITKITEDLQDYFGWRSAGPRSPEIPKVGWVRSALEVLAEFRLARPKGNGEYVIQYKRTRGDTLKKFGRLCFLLEQRRMARADTGTPFFPGLEPRGSAP